jgi:AcrR family transcriptional regulator
MVSSMGRPKEHGNDTRAALLDAAAEILAAQGAAAVSVRKVAERAGTSTRAVYSLYGDKDGLLQALCRRANEVMRRHHEGITVNDADPGSELLSLAFAYRAAAREEPRLYELWSSQGLPDLADDDVQGDVRSFTRVIEAIARCVETGVFAPADPVAIAMQMWALVHGLASLELRGTLGSPASAEQLWSGAVTAAIIGYRRTAPAELAPSKPAPAELAPAKPAPAKPVPARAAPSKPARPKPAPSKPAPANAALPPGTQPARRRARQP